jgi:hypothetical protein
MRYCDAQWGLVRVPPPALVVDDANKGQRLVFRYPAPREPSSGPAPSAPTLSERCTTDFHTLRWVSLFASENRGHDLD